MYLTIDARDVATIERSIALGATLTDVRLEFAASLPDLATPPGGRTRLAERSEEREIACLARELSQASRFSRDARFPRQAVSDMYALWSRRCLLEGVVVVPNEDLCGFVGARGYGHSARVELVYVAPKGRSLGHAAAMLTRAASALPATDAIVATQMGNIAAQRLYQSVGFRSHSAKAVLHHWLDRST